MALAEEVKQTITVTNPALWSAEHPNLYDLTIVVYDENDEMQEIIPQRIGFRRFAMDNGMMTINGKRIVFKGTNRHEFSSRRGRVPNFDEMLKDIITIRNGSRCC